MQNQKNNGKYPLTLKIIIPDKEPLEFFCESVHLNVCDNKSGKGGGLYGIHKGHESAVFALSQGPLTAYAENELTVSLSLSDGFARVEKDIIYVTVTSAKEKNQ